MVRILENHNLKSHNTFKIDVKAKYFAEAFSTEEVIEILKSPEYINSENKFILGGGSNILFTKDYDGIVVKISIKGIHVVEDTPDYTIIEFGAGEVWDNAVKYCVNKNYWGIENLTLIPGTVGASPVQNIGAYGVELKDVFHSLKALEVDTHKLIDFNHEMCKFGYRESYFKKEGKNKYIVTSVSLKLGKTPNPNINYKDLKEIFQGKTPNINEIRESIIKIRKDKLPDLEKYGCAGSFFKHPIVEIKKKNELQEKYPEMPVYEDQKGYKIPAGWLIEKAGYKGFRINEVGVYEKHALVLINYCKSTGSEIYEFANFIKIKVRELFGVELQEEVDIIE